MTKKFAILNNSLSDTSVLRKIKKDTARIHTILNEGKIMSKSLQQKQGVVVSKSGDKTIKVTVKTRKRHPFYKRLLMFLGQHWFTTKKMKQKLVIK